MVKPLKIEAGDESPLVLLDKDNGIFEISGRSFPEDSAAFYAPVLAWIKAYTLNPNPTTEFTFKLDYSNTSSSKFIYDLIVMLKSINGITIKWCYREDDEDMLQAGSDLSEQVLVPFKFDKYR